MKLWNQIKSFIIHAVIHQSALSWQGPPTTASSHPSNIAALKEMLQRYKAAGNAVFDLTRQNSISDVYYRDKCITT